MMPASSPSATSGRSRNEAWKKTFRATPTRSQVSASLNPAPAVYPSTAAISGWGSAWSERTARRAALSRSTGARTPVPLEVMALMSPPAEKQDSPPVSTTARTRGSAAMSWAACRSSIQLRRASALRTSG